MNNGTCIDKLDSYECSCLFGNSGAQCERQEYWTLQQWTAQECGGQPWRCFKLKVGECIDTGFSDGNMPKTDVWWGQLNFDGENSYTIDLCWWGAGVDKEEKCKCANHYTNVPKLGRNSLGPPSELGTDSTMCHKLMKITSSRLINSTGMGSLGADGEPSNMLCGVEAGAPRMATMKIAILSIVILLPTLFST